MRKALKMENKSLDFDKAFKLMVFAMNFNRSHPSIKRDFKWMWQAGRMYGIFFFVFVIIVYSIINIDLKRGNITQAAANGVLCLIFSIATYKYCIMWYYRDVLIDIINKINIDYGEAQHLPEDEKKIVESFMKKGQDICKRWFILIIVTGVTFLLKSFGMMIYYTVFDEFKFVHLYEMTYPQVVEDIKDTWGMFIVLYGIFLFYDVYGALMYLAFEPFGAVLMLHACGQLEIVRNRILKLYQKKYTDNEVIEQLREIAIYLQKIYSFVDNIKFSFKMLYELTLKATAVALPVTMYQIIQSFKKGELRIEFITVTIASMCLSTIPCYYSDMLKEAGKGLNQAVYECGWERHWEPKSRKLLLLLLFRTSKSMAVRTLFLEVCLLALTDVYHMAFAIFNLLNAI